jgi:hypothetical protein
MYHWKAIIELNMNASNIKTLRISTKLEKKPREIHVTIKAESTFETKMIRIISIEPCLNEALEYKAAIIKSDGTITEAKPADGKHFTLKEMQSIVGGYIEVITFTNKFRRPPHLSIPTKLMICNEEGKLNNLPVNKKMSEIWKDYFGIYSDIIVGNVLICDPDMVK